MIKRDDLQPLEVNEQKYNVPSTPLSKFAKEGKWLKTRFAIFLAQIKAENNSNKLKNKVRKILYLLYQHNKITKKLYNNSIKLLW